jgi:hypothetical protein
LSLTRDTKMTPSVDTGDVYDVVLPSGQQNESLPARYQMIRVNVFIAGDL